MTKRNITITVKGDDIQDFQYSSNYTKELFDDLDEIDNFNREFVLIECTFESALDALREKLGK